MLPIILALVLFGACTAPQVQPEKPMIEVVEVIPPSPYMTKNEIIKEMMNDQKGFMDEPLTAKEKEREKNLNPDSLFMPKGQKTMGEFSEKEAQTLPQEVDLRHRDSPIRSQNNGLCSAFAGTSAMNNMLNRHSVDHVPELSPWHAWSMYRVYSIESFMKTMMKYRVGDEADYPQGGKKSPKLKAHAMITKANYIGDNLVKMQTALANGNVVYLGMKTPREMLRCKKVVTHNSMPSSGGHALVISGYFTDLRVPGEVVGILKNSWGKDCGDNGYQYVQLGALCGKKGFYCSMYEILEVDSNK